MTALRRRYTRLPRVYPRDYPRAAIRPTEA
jgi:hypothetical protein